MKPYCVTIQMKAIEQYFHVVLFIMLHKVVLAFKSVDESLVFDYSNKGYLVVFHVLLFTLPLVCDHLNGSYLVVPSSYM